MSRFQLDHQRRQHMPRFGLNKRTRHRRVSCFRVQGQRFCACVPFKPLPRPPGAATPSPAKGNFHAIGHSPLVIASIARQSTERPPRPGGHPSTQSPTKSSDFAGLDGGELSPQQKEQVRHWRTSLLSALYTLLSKIDDIPTRCVTPALQRGNFTKSLYH